MVNCAICWNTQSNSSYAMQIGGEANVLPLTATHLNKKCTIAVMLQLGKLSDSQAISNKLNPEMPFSCLQRV